MNQCFSRELDVELDKRRRDIKRHDEWWWRVLYDESGEVADQANWDGSWFLTMKFKELFGIDWRNKNQGKSDNTTPSTSNTPNVSNTPSIAKIATNTNNN